MKIGIIGSGKIGLAFAKQAIKAGYEVLVSNSRGPASLAEVVRDIKGVQAGTVEEALKADVIFLAVQWIHLSAIAGQYNWKGKLVIDPINPVVPPDYKMAELNGRPSSEVVSEMLSGARVVKAFNTFTPELLSAAPEQSGGRRVIFFSGNDAEAKRTVLSIIEKMGFAGIDLGGFEASKLQQYPSGPLPGLNLIKLS